MAYWIKNISWSLNKTVGQTHISLSPPLLSPPHDAHHPSSHDLPWQPAPHHDATAPSIICNSTNYLHTHLGCALDDNVQKQQGKQISIHLFMNKNHSPSLVFALTSRRPRGATDFTIHLPHSPHLIPRASLIDRRRGAEAIWGWDIALFTCFACCLYLTLTNLILPFVAPPITPPTPTSIPSASCRCHLDAQIYIPDEEMQWKKVRYDMKPLHLQFFGYFTHLHFACQTKQQNFTQQQNPTRQSTLKPVTKESGKKKR